MRRFSFLAVALSLAAIPGLPTYGQQDQDAEIAFVKELFFRLQPKSIRANREYCGYIGYDAAGRLQATQPARGGIDFCEPSWPLRFDPVASYHTHAGYDPGAWSELPSGSDMESDEAEGVDGYVATPGGRLWYIDSLDMVASQICGVGCLPMDPDFAPDADITVQTSYRYEDLIEISAENGY